jgi:hypothetical protein
VLLFFARELFFLKGLRKALLGETHGFPTMVLLVFVVQGITFLRLKAVMLKKMVIENFFSQ